MNLFAEPLFLQGVVVGLSSLLVGHLLIGIIDAIGRIYDRVQMRRLEAEHDRTTGAESSG